MSEETEVVAVETPEAPSADAQALEAFSKGAESVSEGANGAEKPADVAGATGPGPVSDAVAATPGATAAAGPTPEEKATAELKAADDAEIKKLGIGGAKNEVAAARFRELNAEARKVPELKKQIETMAPLAAEAQQYMEIVNDVGAKPEQIAQMFKYLKAINSEDAKEMNSAADTLLNEVLALFKFLGRELPAFDPVADHADLKQALEAGGVTPELARETARTRAQQTATELRQNAEKAERERAEENDRQLDAAVQGLNTIGTKLKTSDTHYTAKLAAMQSAGTIDVIKDTVHPSRWVEAFQKAYARIPEPAPKPVVGAMPLRPTGSDPNAQQRAPKDDYEAFAMGAASVR